MIARAHHAVNGGGARSEPVLPDVPGLDLALSVDNVARFGGDPHRYVSALTAALTVDPDLARSRDRMLAVASVAAWRSGVLGIRADALVWLPQLSPDIGAAVLGLPADALGAFRFGQAVDRFYWPLRPGHSTQPFARLGGFVGLGGAWEFPPTEPVLEGPGRWTVQVGAARWRLEADLFGHALGPVGPAVPPPSTRERVTAQLVVRPTSFLADVVPWRPA
ncbi:potassium transporter Kef [Mycolicibacterium sp. P9-64]|uniref:potassium transporter Kef n=1 Tax=Mycolicibacterium sp. P9-64 TaxID=2024612 RepID=UPI0011EE315F|nr:potassium transporter Kef [Mycolicibacterium sp. P9-64]KAA0080219.1 potassium transporter Kef [Mycolicibacterium sp. P9-64]